MIKGIIGGFGGAFAGLCCAGIPIVLAFLTGIGLGFLINDFILFPILFVALGFMFYSMYYNKKQHLSLYPIYLAILSTILIGIGIFKGTIIWLGVIGLLISTIWDYTLVRKCKNCKIK